MFFFFNSVVFFFDEFVKVFDKYDYYVEKG